MFATNLGFYSLDSHGCRIRQGPKSKLKEKPHSESQKLKDKSQQRKGESWGSREAKTVAYSSSRTNSRVTESETDEGDGKEEEKARQSKEDLVQQQDHRNTDLFTD